MKHNFLNIFHIIKINNENDTKPSDNIEAQRSKNNENNKLIKKLKKNKNIIKSESSESFELNNELEFIASKISKNNYNLDKLKNVNIYKSMNIIKISNFSKFKIFKQITYDYLFENSELITSMDISKFKNLRVLSIDLPIYKYEFSFKKDLNINLNNTNIKILIIKTYTYNYKYENKLNINIILNKLKYCNIYLLKIIYYLI